MAAPDNFIITTGGGGGGGASSGQLALIQNGPECMLYSLTDIQTNGILCEHFCRKAP